MEGCFMSQWWEGVVFQTGVFFLKLEGAPWWSIGFDGGGVFRKKLLDGGGGNPHAPPLWKTLGRLYAPKKIG